MLEGLYMWAWVPYTYMDMMLHLMSLSWSIGLWTRWGDTRKCLSREGYILGLGIVIVMNVCDGCTLDMVVHVILF
jgi:hypothetical protein